MARARLIKPGFYKNEQLAECSLLARFIFPGLWMLADRRGRLEDRPKRLKADLLPYDDADVGALLDELVMQGLLVRYQSGDMRLIQIVSFETHQNCHVREPESAYPAPQEAVPSTGPAPDKNSSGPAEALNPNPLTEAVKEHAQARPTLPTDEHRQIAAVQQVDCEAELAKYTDWLATNRKRHTNREAGFRNWLRRAGEFKARDAPKLTAADRRADTADQMFRRGKYAVASTSERDITSTAERLD
jgi:hypothetical protein